MFIFPVFAAKVGGIDFIPKDQPSVLPVIQSHDAPAVAAVPEAVVMPAGQAAGKQPDPERGEIPSPQFLSTF